MNFDISISWSMFRIILDVLMVSVLIYNILVFVKGTRALPMIAGLCVLLALYWVSVRIGLVTLNWILGNFLGSVILVIVVLFQEDLRRGLVKVGLVPGLGGDDHPGEKEFALKAVARAASELSSRGLGALMIVSREVGLKEYTEHAVKLDALVSYQLLVSLFVKESPLHDGAVVLHDDRIIAAGAVLPLTFNPKISSSFGTRHRAAIGLSEKTDALCVVVSEETGIISLVSEAKVTRDLTEKTLYNELLRGVRGYVVLSPSKSVTTIGKRNTSESSSRAVSDKESVKAGEDSKPNSDIT